MNQEMNPSESPAPPDSLPKYIREGLPKQDLETLSETRDYIDQLLEWSEASVDEDDLPEDAEPIDEDDEEGKGTVVLEKVTCGDETCKCMKKGEKHGPYKYRYYRKPNGNLTSEYVDNE